MGVCTYVRTYGKSYAYAVTLSTGYPGLPPCFPVLTELNAVDVAGGHYSTIEGH